MATRLTWRALHPSGSKHAGQGVGRRGSGQLPQPTSALPGTDEKVAVMVVRARLGQALFHPDDAGMPPRPGQDDQVGGEGSACLQPNSIR
jgi:hypothetical protein